MTDKSSFPFIYSNIYILCATANLFTSRLFHSQIIIQGLRESGTFTSVIESALTNLPKDTSLSSIENLNTSRADESKVFSSRKMGKHTEIQANGRKILAMDTDFAAIPPLSPPSVDDIHLDT